MTQNENENDTNPAYLFSKTLKRSTETQAEFLRRMASMQFETMQGLMNVLHTITNFNAVFKATVQSNGRISIPEAEREALGIEDGDLVQVIIVPLEKGKERTKVKDDSQKFQIKGGVKIE
ncbi:MAG: AbrB/MazE/SpoVT family DNA-binding domain-containing protein [Nitrososphaerales archaeon]